MLLRCAQVRDTFFTFVMWLELETTEPDCGDHTRRESDANLTLYPEDLMCTPLFVSVDFILMKKDRSRVLSGARRLGLLDSTEKPKDTEAHKL